MASPSITFLAKYILTSISCLGPFIVLNCGTPRDDPPLRPPGGNARSSGRRSIFVWLTDQIQVQHFFCLRSVHDRGQRLERRSFVLPNILLVAGKLDHCGWCNALQGRRVAGLMNVFLFDLDPILLMALTTSLPAQSARS